MRKDATETDGEIRVRGLICEALYVGSKYRSWMGRDKQNAGREKTFRVLYHRFTWETDNGEEYMQVVEWLPDSSNATRLADCTIPYAARQPYKLLLRGLKEEGGILQAEAREIVPIP